MSKVRSYLEHSVWAVKKFGYGWAGHQCSSWITKHCQTLDVYLRTSQVTLMWLLSEISIDLHLFVYSLFFFCRISKHLVLYCRKSYFSKSNLLYHYTICLWCVILQHEISSLAHKAAAHTPPFLLPHRDNFKHKTAYAHTEALRKYTIIQIYTN